VATEILRCVFDEEETMRDLAIESTAQIWFKMSPSAASKSPLKGQPTKKVTKRTVEEEEEEDKMSERWNEAETAKAKARLRNMVQVADALRGKPSPVEKMLRHIVKRRCGDELQKQMSQLVDLTVDNIVETQQQAPEAAIHADELIKQVAFISLLTKINPATLSVRKAKVLLPYLRGGTSKAEVTLLGHLLSIFNTCLPSMPRTALLFAKQLQPLLTPLLNKPTQHYAVLEELIRCYCSVVRCHTHDYSILIKCMQVSYRRLKAIQQSSSSSLQLESNRSNAVVLMTTTSLLTENADFDLIREENPEFAVDIDQITPDNVGEEITSKLVELMGKEALRKPALHSLRIVCRAFPRLIMGQETSKMVEGILRQGNDQERSAVLSIMEEIMAVELVKFDPDQALGDKKEKGKAVKAYAIQSPLRLWKTIST
jgi:cohesin loading factor subunit SCC2